MFNSIKKAKSQKCAVLKDWPEHPVVDDHHDDDWAPEGHKGGEEGVGEVGVEDTEPRFVINGRFARPKKLLSTIIQNWTMKNMELYYRKTNADWILIFG